MTVTRGAKRPKHSAAASTRVLSNGIAKSLTDKREYRLVELPNEMRVLLISDPEIGRESSEPKPSGARKGAGRGREEEDDDEEMDGGEEDECESGDDDDESEGEEDDEGDEEEGGKPARRPRDSRGGASVGEGGDEEDATKKAACALCLGVGYLCDPKQVDGLAHFTEHMLFMGTKSREQRVSLFII
ncbi:hypothetical protein T492DRAFT_839644 [Pavlovales sp. CCMP2436]|nr:hypothetical protein T492DRAFT_839644 [Pavlovales sp. CCMP2436]